MIKRRLAIKGGVLGWTYTQAFLRKDGVALVLVPKSRTACGVLNAFFVCTPCMRTEEEELRLF